MSKNERRINRKEQRRLQIERERRMRLLRIWGPISVLILVIVAIAITRFSEPEIAGAIFVDTAASNQHDGDIHYEFGGLPPTGGVHRPTWQNCGIYLEPVLPEFAIHSMEHGAVWITYHPDLSPEEVNALQDEIRGENHLLLSPFPDQDSTIVLTAWDVQLQVENSDDERIAQFIDRFRHTRGPESASCSGGVGTPVG